MAEAAGSHVNIFKNLEDNIRLVVQQIKDGESERENQEKFCADRYWEYLGTVFKALSQEGTKISLAFTKPPFPSVKECEAMTARIEQTVLHLVSAFYSLPKTQGMTLRKNLQHAVLEILEAVLGLVASLAQFDPGAGERKQATGVVWEGANSFPSLPKNNVDAVKKTLEQSSGLVEDAVMEVDEILNNDGRCEDIFGDAAGEELDNANAWTDQDREMVAPVKGLVKTAVKLLKKAKEASKAKAKCDSEEHIAQLDDLSDCAQQLSPAVDDLIISLYAPVDRAAVKDCATTLHEVISNMLKVLRHSHITEEADNKWMDFLQKVNTHNLTTLTDLLNK